MVAAICIADRRSCSANVVAAASIFTPVASARSLRRAAIAVTAADTAVTAAVVGCNTGPALTDAAVLDSATASDPHWAAKVRSPANWMSRSPTDAV